MSMEFNENSEARIEDLILKAAPPRRRPAKLAREMRLHHDLGIDSLGMMALVFRLEQAFGVKVSQFAPGIDMHRLRTVQDLVDVSRKLLQQDAAQ
jgi:acyl carrier protein